MHKFLPQYWGISGMIGHDWNTDYSSLINKSFLYSVNYFSKLRSVATA